jgi:hypothetical protein
VLVEVPSYSSLSSSTGPPLEIAVYGTFLMGAEGDTIKEAQHLKFERG